jgi:regulator of RNase E activity RraB
LLAAEKIAVEVKSFVSPSEVDDLKSAVGQYILCHDILSRISRTLWLEEIRAPGQIQR